MASKAPDYDAMADSPPDSEPAGSAGDDSDGALDEELMMHAKDAGLDEAKATALKAFVDRCMELQEQGDYGDEGDDEGAGESDEE